jgi:hypothetical protein
VPLGEAGERVEAVARRGEWFLLRARVLDEAGPYLHMFPR